MFNPTPQVHRVDLSATGDPEAVAVVVDDFLLDPGALVHVAVQHREAVRPLCQHGAGQRRGDALLATFLSQNEYVARLARLGTVPVDEEHPTTV